MSSSVQAEDDYVLLKDCMGTKSSLWRVQVDDKYIDVEGQMREKGWNPQDLPPTTHLEDTGARVL